MYLIAGRKVNELHFSNWNMYGQNTSKENKNEEIKTHIVLPRTTVSCRIKPATRIEGWVCSIKLSDKHNMHKDHSDHSAHKTTTITTYYIDNDDQDGFENH